MSADRPPRAAVRAAVRVAVADLDPGDRVLVALSGGPDSLALLAGTVRVAAERGLVCGAVVVDHGLQAQSSAVARRAAEQARLFGCAQVAVVRVEVARGPRSGGLEAAARNARHAALRRAAAESPPAAAVLLGHTRDDQAETVLLGLARGSGIRSLAGMAPVSGLLRRPLLGLPRAVVAQAAAETALEDPRLEPWIDPHNADRGHARVRVRTEVLPALEDALGPGIADALARTAQLARVDADALDAWAERVWAAQVAPLLGRGAIPDPGSDAAAMARPSPHRPEGGNEVALEHHFHPTLLADEGVRVPVAALGADEAGPLPAAVTSRLVRRLLVAAGCPEGSLTADHVGRVLGLLVGASAGAEVALPGNRRARRVDRALVVRA